MSETLHVAVPGALDQPTGGYRYDAALVRALRNRGWQVVVHELPGCHPLPDPPAVAGAERTLAAAAGSTLVVDGLCLPAFARTTCAGVRLVALIHHRLTRETGTPAASIAPLVRLERDGLQRAQLIICTSAATAADLQRAYGLPSPPLVAPPAIETTAPRTPWARAPRRLLAVGALVPRKDVLLLIEALAPLRHLPWRLDIVGDDSRHPAYARRVRSRCRRHRLVGRIRLHGAIADWRRRRLLRQADLLLAASRHEGYGMAVAEAAAAGLPILATATAAVPAVFAAAAVTRVPARDRLAMTQALAVRAPAAWAPRYRRARRHAPRWATHDPAACIAPALCALARPRVIGA